MFKYDCILYQQQNGGKNGDVWDIDKEIGIIEPHDSVTLQVTATLSESGYHNVLLRVEMQDTNSFTDIKIKIKGIGASLVFLPDLKFEDEIDFGPVFL